MNEKQEFSAEPVISKSEHAKEIGKKLLSFFNERKVELVDDQRELLAKYEHLFMVRDDLAEKIVKFDAESHKLDEQEDSLRISEIRTRQEEYTDRIDTLDEEINQIEKKLDALKARYEALMASTDTRRKIIKNN